MQDELMKDQSNDHLLKETLNYINDLMVGKAQEPSNEDDYEFDKEAIFAEYVISWLTDNNHLIFPENSEEGELIPHRFKAKIKDYMISVWGSGIFQQGYSDSYGVHLFAVNYQDSEDIKIITKDETDNIVTELKNFFKFSAKGKLRKAMYKEHPAFPVVERIEKLWEEEKISWVKFWILTNRVSEVEDKTGSKEEKGINYAIQLVDLSTLGLILSDESEINQTFTDSDAPEAILIPSTADQNYDCYLTSLDGLLLAKLYSKHGPAMVRSNVRAYLGEVKINKSIMLTIQEEPSCFLAYNNGLVITADSAIIEENKLKSLKGIQVINGGQTTASIYQYWISAKNKRKDPTAGAKAEENLKNIRMPAKIIVNKGMDDMQRAQFRMNISIAANSQNVVKASDLASNSPFQIQLATKLKNMPIPTGTNEYWFYEHSRKLYQAEMTRFKGDRKGLNNFKKTFPQSMVFNKTELSLAYLSTAGLPTIAAQGVEQAFKYFNDDILEKSGKCSDSYKMSTEEAQELVARYILYKTLEKLITKGKMISNPRVPILYTLAMFSKVFGNRIRWNLIWEKQQISLQLQDILKAVLLEIDSIIRSNMGTNMISQFGRRNKCLEVVEKNFSFDGYPMESVPELSTKGN